MIRRVLLLVASLPIIAAAQAAAPAPAQPAAKPEIYFREPANGATVAATFSVVFGLRNYGIAPAGINVANTGHFHIIVDGQAPGVGMLIPPNDSINRHFGSGVIETKLTLKPGVHTLQLVLGDFEHKVISSDLVSVPIKVTVK
jgi:hypothetical protein